MAEENNLDNEFDTPDEITDGSTDDANDLDLMPDDDNDSEINSDESDTETVKKESPPSRSFFK